jgi:hypothetical protein
MQGFALIFAVLAFVFLIISLCDLFLGLGWGYSWWAPVLALVQMAVGFTVNRVLKARSIILNPGAGDLRRFGKSLIS